MDLNSRSLGALGTEVSRNSEKLSTNTELTNIVQTAGKPLTETGTGKQYYYIY